jgi:hypothetical protein
VSDAGNRRKKSRGFPGGEKDGEGVVKKDKLKRGKKRRPFFYVFSRR